MTLIVIDSRTGSRRTIVVPAKARTDPIEAGQVIHLVGQPASRQSGR